MVNVSENHLMHISITWTVSHELTAGTCEPTVADILTSVFCRNFSVTLEPDGSHDLLTVDLITYTNILDFTDDIIQSKVTLTFK